MVKKLLILLLLGYGQFCGAMDSEVKATFPNKKVLYEIFCTNGLEDFAKKTQAADLLAESLINAWGLRFYETMFLKDYRSSFCWEKEGDGLWKPCKCKISNKEMVDIEKKLYSTIDGILRDFPEVQAELRRMRCKV